MGGKWHGMEKYEKRKRFIINVAYYVVISVFVLAGCKFILPVMVPFIIAFLVSVLIQIPVKKFAKRFPARRKMAAVLCCSLFYAFFFALVLLLGVKLLQGAGNVIISAPALYNERIVPVFGEVAKRLETAAASVDMEMSQKIEEIFSEFSQNVGQYITDFSVKTVRLLSDGAVKIPGFIVRLVVTVVSTFFMASDFDRIIGFAKKVIPAGKEESVGRTMEYIRNVLFIYLKSYTFLFLLTFVELLVGFLVLRIPYAAVLAVAIAIFDILPVLGTGGILLPWAVVLLIMGNTSLAVGLLVLYVMITAIRNTVEPKIVGKQIGLHPLATLVFMFIGLKVLGIIGMILFPVGLSIFVNLEKNGVIHVFSRKEKNQN